MTMATSDTTANPEVKTNGSARHNGDVHAISEEEAALYDRQIRLWGAEAQKKLRDCNVLLVGMSGVGSEVAKNIVLAGINSLTIVDSTPITVSDSLNNLFTMRAVGENRATKSQPNVQALNPMVRVSSKELDIKELLAEEGTPRLNELLATVNVVCITNSDKTTALRLNSIVRSLDKKILFYWTNCWGFFGFSFTDLGKAHKYLAEEIINSSECQLEDGSGEPARKKTKPNEQEKQIVEKSLDYPSLETTLAVKAGKAGVGLTKRTNPVFVVTHVMLEFHEKHGRFPQDRQDVEELKLIQQDVIDSQLGLDASFAAKLDTLSWWDKIFGEMSPISSIVGGVVGQDIIRAVSAKETPIKNVFLFNGLDCNGIIETVGK